MSNNQTPAQTPALLLSFVLIPTAAFALWGWAAALLAFGITMLVYGKGDA